MASMFGSSSISNLALARPRCFRPSPRLALVGALDLGNVVRLGELLPFLTVTSSHRLDDDFRVRFGRHDQGHGTAHC